MRNHFFPSHNFEQRLLCLVYVRKDIWIIWNTSEDQQLAEEFVRWVKLLCRDSKTKLEVRQVYQNHRSTLFRLLLSCLVIDTAERNIERLASLACSMQMLYS